MKADNIVVLKKGQVAQQGTHDELLADKEGPYWGLANAQQLAMGDDSTTNPDCFDAERQDADPSVFEKVSMDLQSATSPEESVYIPKGFLGSFWLFLWEQKRQWRWYSLMLLGALGAGGKPIHNTSDAGIYFICHYVTHKSNAS